MQNPKTRAKNTLCIIALKHAENLWKSSDGKYKGQKFGFKNYRSKHVEAVVPNLFGAKSRNIIF